MARFRYQIIVTVLDKDADRFEDLAEVIQTDIEDVLPVIFYTQDDAGEDHEVEINIESMEYRP